MKYSNKNHMNSRFSQTSNLGHQPPPAEVTNTQLHALNPMKVAGVLIPYRDSDGYYSATAIADRGRHWQEFRRLPT
jgi:hypothetical protein